MRKTLPTKKSSFIASFIFMMLSMTLFIYNIMTLESFDRETNGFILKRYSRGASNDFFSIQFSYTKEDTSYNGRINLRIPYGGKRFKVGDQVPIKYDSTNPEESATIDHFIFLYHRIIDACFVFAFAILFF